MNSDDAKKTITRGNAALKAAMFAVKTDMVQPILVKAPQKVLRNQCPTCTKLAVLEKFTNSLTGVTSHNCRQCITAFRAKQEEADFALAQATEDAMRRQEAIAVPEPVHVVRPVAQLVGCMLCEHTATVFPENGISLCDRCAADQQGGM